MYFCELWLAKEVFPQEGLDTDKSIIFWGCRRSPDGSYLAFTVRGAEQVCSVVPAHNLLPLSVWPV